MNITELLAEATIDRADAEILLASILQQQRTWLLAHPSHTPTAEQLSLFRSYHERRAAHEPVAYITGQREFFGRTFLADKRALIPRSSTEGLVELALALADGTIEDGTLRAVDTHIVAFAERRAGSTMPTHIADIGTGSGCIAITMACERPLLRMIGTDRSASALALARDNAARHSVSDRIEWKIGSVLEPLLHMHEPFLLVSNPPYVPTTEELPQDVKSFEPHQALFAGPNGTDVLVPLIAQARAHPSCVGFAIECRADQIASIINS